MGKEDDYYRARDLSPDGESTIALDLLPDNETPYEITVTVGPGHKQVRWIRVGMVKPLIRALDELKSAKEGLDLSPFFEDRYVDIWDEVHELPKTPGVAMTTVEGMPLTQEIADDLCFAIQRMASLGNKTVSFDMHQPCVELAPDGPFRRFMPNFAGATLKVEIR